MRYIRQQITLATLMIIGSSSVCGELLAEPTAAIDANSFAALDGYMLGLTDAQKFSGVMLVAHDGRIVFHKAYGTLDENSETLAQPNSRYNVASLGKMFTSVATLQQIAAGKLSLDTTVGEVLKDYPNREFADNVTVRQLLTHTAGAGDIDLFGVENAENRTRTKTVADMLALHSKRAPAFTPGTQQQYGNFGYVVLGRMVEVLSGVEYESYVQKHIFMPAGMKHTGFIDCTDDAPDIAHGYVDVSGKRLLNCATLPNRGFPAGGEVSSAADLLAFVSALQTGKLLPPALFAEAIRTQREFMGLGFFATGYGLGVPERDFRWGHGGSADGICTEVRTYPTTGETMIVLSNKDAPFCYGATSFLHNRWNVQQSEK